MNLPGANVLTAIKTRTQTIWREELPAALGGMRTVGTTLTVGAFAVGSNSQPLIQILTSRPSQAATRSRTAPTTRPGVGTRFKERLLAVDATYQQTIKRYVDPLFGATRQQQMAEMNSAETEAMMAAYERELNPNLGLRLQGHIPGPRLIYQNLWLAQA